MSDPYRAPESELIQEVAFDASGLASRGKRLGGSLIDSLISVPITYGLFYAFGLFDVIATGEISSVQLLQTAVIGFVVFISLNGYLLSNRGQTIGKLVVKTQIVDKESEEVPTLSRLLGLRYLPLWIVGSIPGLGTVAGLVNVLFIFRPDRKCVHDHFARTKVIELPSEPR